MRRQSHLLRTLLLTISLWWTAEAFALKYGPYAGVEGYQEIAVADEVFFVAFHGNRDSAMTEIEAAWKVRAAQLCIEHSATHFIQLRYSFEPVLTTDVPVIRRPDKEAMGYFVRTAGPVYIPIYTPRRSGGASVDAPSKQAHVRCVRDPSQVRSAERLFTAEQAIDDGKNRGWLAGGTKKP